MLATGSPPRSIPSERLVLDGYVIEPLVIPASVCDEAVDLVTRLSGESAGTRTLLDEPMIEEVSLKLRAHPGVATLLPTDAIVAQCTLFSKGLGANWSVAAHQDLSIPVARRIDAAGCTGWSFKEGVWFVQPPDHVLDDLVAIRLQLDQDSPRGGRLRVVPGSHSWGRAPAAEIARRLRASDWVDCVVPRGGVLAMKPLLVHSSRKAKPSVARRVLHFLFGPPTLPHGLEWPVGNAKA
jgi:hypothetical protein